jgi:intracellular multiplication protein IcmK
VRHFILYRLIVVLTIGFCVCITPVLAQDNSAIQTTNAPGLASLPKEVRPMQALRDQNLPTSPLPTSPLDVVAPPPEEDLTEQAKMLSEVEALPGQERVLKPIEPEIKPVQIVNEEPVAEESKSEEPKQVVVEEKKPSDPELDEIEKAIKEIARAKESQKNEESGLIKKLSEALPLNKKSKDKSIDMRIDPKLVAADATGEEVEEELPPLSYEEQLLMRTKELDQQARNEAFERSKRALLPLETYEIRDLFKRLKITQEAIQKPALPQPKPKNVVKTISTDPSVRSETIKLAAGHVTAMNIIDISGSPWPIVDIAYGGNFDIKAPDPGGSLLRITPLREFAQGNMIIRLLGMTTPLTFLLSAGNKEVNHRFDARIPQYGPNSQTPLIQTDSVETTAGDSVMTSVLEGVAPSNAEKLVVEGLDGRTSAYRLGGVLYLRTPLALLSPAWRSSATSSDGLNVYVMAEAPVLLLSDAGKLVRARLSSISRSGG